MKADHATGAGAE